MDEKVLQVAGVTANCGNSTLGKKACAHMTALLDPERGDTDVLVINCQEVSFEDTLRELKEALPRDGSIGIVSSDLRITRTTPFNFNVIVGRTGIATIVLYRTRELSSVSFQPEAQRSTTARNANKGGFVNRLSITTTDGKTSTIQTISAHLDSFSEVGRMDEWRGMKAATYANANHWDDLVSSIPDLQVAGFDANTRNRFALTGQAPGEINLWQAEQLDKRIAPFVLAPLGETLYSAARTYHPGSREGLADPKRLGYSQAGSLDFVSIQNNTQHSQSLFQGESKYYVPARESLPLENGTSRDHRVIISPPTAIQNLSPFDRVKYYLANELKYAAPGLSESILARRDSLENRSCLFEIYHHYFTSGLLLEKIRYAKECEVVDPWFEQDAWIHFDWRAMRLARGYTGEPLSESSSDEAIQEKRQLLKGLIEKNNRDRKKPAKPLTVSDDSIIITILSKIPIIAGLIHRLRGAGNHSYALATLNNPVDLVDAGSRTPGFIAESPSLRSLYINTYLIASIADFIELPLVYFASWLLGKPCPVSTTRFGQWVYSGVILGLAIASLIFPAAALGIMAASIILGFISTVYFYRQFMKQEFEVTSALMSMPLDIQNLEATISQLNRAIQQTMDHLDNASRDELNQLADHVSALKSAQTQWDDLHMKSQVLTKEAEAFRGINAVDRAVGLVFSTMLVIAVGFLLAAPPIGLMMFSVLTVIGGSYTVGRFIYEMVVHMQGNKSAPTSSTGAIINSLDPEQSTRPQVEPEHTPSPVGAVIAVPSMHPMSSTADDNLTPSAEAETRFSRPPEPS